MKVYIVTCSVRETWVDTEESNHFHFVLKGFTDRKAARDFIENSKPTDYILYLNDEDYKITEENLGGIRKWDAKPRDDNAAYVELIVGDSVLTIEE